MARLKALYHFLWRRGLKKINANLEGMNDEREREILNVVVVK